MPGRPGDHDEVPTQPGRHARDGYAEVDVQVPRGVRGAYAVRHRPVPGRVLECRLPRRRLDSLRGQLRIGCEGIAGGRHQPRSDIGLRTRPSRRSAYDTRAGQ